MKGEKKTKENAPVLIYVHNRSMNLHKHYFFIFIL